MNPLPVLPHVAHVAQTIQLALAPVFLLTGVGAFLNLCAGRLARIIDRTRVVAPQVRSARGEEHDRLVREIRLLDQRIAVVNRAILMGVLSGGMTCLVVMLLFVAEMIAIDLGRVIGLLFILSMIALAAAFALFIREIHLAARTVHVEPEILRHQASE